MSNIQTSSPSLPSQEDSSIADASVALRDSRHMAVELSFSTSAWGIPYLHPRVRREWV